MNDKDNQKDLKKIRKVKSFVKRNRKLTESKQHLLDTAYPVWGISWQQGAQDIWDFKQLFNNQNNVILEIGFGRGNTLLANAKANNDYNYIGIEVFQSGVLNILENLEASNNKLDNLRVCEGDAKEILTHNIPDNSLYGVQIFFPDPWPKKRHHKRRLIQTDFVELLACKITSGGFIHLATDWAHYAEQMLEVLNANKKYCNLAENNSFYDNNKLNRLLTKFEERGIAKGHQVFDLYYKIKK